jgi:hypothetical protein
VVGVGGLLRRAVAVAVVGAAALVARHLVRAQRRVAYVPVGLVGCRRASARRRNASLPPTSCSSSLPTSHCPNVTSHGTRSDPRSVHSCRETSRCPCVAGRRKEKNQGIESINACMHA